MNKKIIALVGTCLLITIGFLTFGASSTASSHNIAPVNISAEQTSSANSETPQAVWGVVAKGAQKAWVYGKHAYQANKSALGDAARQGTFWAGGLNESDMKVETVEEIFDK